MWFISGYLIGLFSAILLLGLCKAAGDYDDSMPPIPEDIEETEPPKKGQKAPRKA